MVEMNLDKMDLTAMESKAIYEKIKKTDKKYPRNYSMIDKRPL